MHVSSPAAISNNNLLHLGIGGRSNRTSHRTCPAKAQTWPYLRVLTCSLPGRHLRRPICTSNPHCIGVCRDGSLCAPQRASPRSAPPKRGATPQDTPQAPLAPARSPPGPGGPRRWIPRSPPPTNPLGSYWISPQLHAQSGAGRAHHWVPPLAPPRPLPGFAALVACLGPAGPRAGVTAAGLFRWLSQSALSLELEI